MKRRHRQASAKRGRPFRVWTHAEAQGAVPYITSVVRSLREHYLNFWSASLRLRRLRDKPGRPDRAALLALEEARQEAERAEQQLTEADRELARPNVYLLEPAQGLALIPFAHPDGRLAWFVFDLFAPDQLGSWRFHDDPLEERRPLNELTREPPAPTLLV